MFGLTSPPKASAEAETVEEYRRYPLPEELLLSPPRADATAPPQHTASTSPVDPVAPRHRSPAATATASSSSASSTFTEVMPDERGGSDDTAATTNLPMANDEPREENKQGDYKAAPSAPEVEEKQPPPHQQPSAPPRISVRLRWGFEVADLRRVYEMHEDAFPLSYGPSYYRWLLDHDACMALVATVTPDTYTRWADTAAMAQEKDGAREDAPLSWFPGYTPDSPAEAAEGPRPVPRCASQRPLTVEVINERAEIDGTLTELEYIAERERDARQASSNSTGSTAPAKDGAEAYTEVIGFILGQCAYARHDKGHLFTNPTSYIGSFVVDPRFQRCGLGSELLQRFLVYVTQQRPLYARDYLHYDERKLIAMLVAAQLKKRNALREATTDAAPSSTPSSSAAPSPSSLSTADATPAATATTTATEGSTATSVLHQLLSAYFPEALVWWEDRTARQQLRSRGLTDDEVDAQRFRDRLAPDALTDEEAEDVRRDAKHFLVQTGVRDVWLHCLQGNMAATQLYASRGFTLHRVLRGYYDVDTEPYDANLLVYTSPAVGSVVADSNVAESTPAAEREETSSAAAAAASGMDAVVRQHDVQDHTPPAAAPAAPLAPAATAGTGEGMRRRRHTGGPADEASNAATASPAAPTNASPAVGISLATATAESTTSSPTPPAAAEACEDPRRSLATASWLSPRTYGVVADIVLCTAAEGQEEWQRRVGGSGDVTGRRSWWETLREVFLSVNAVGLLCAVLWLAYNVYLTGKVE